ncbi:MAG TPA: L-seryl-tRNA(Sec) selenium transferase [Fastidiosipila sp.]|nr:L-seryl-tRNA(Sec) selenium transferase [Fastidiosipila sp.]
MVDQNALLRQLPSVDELIKHKAFTELIQAHGHDVVTGCIRDAVAATRLAVIEHTVYEINKDALIADIDIRVMEKVQFGTLPVVNATGVVLHTNLGRAPAPQAVATHVAEIIRRYNTVEFDLTSGSRGDRGAAVERFLVELTGAQASLVVNNNAAAMLLALQTLCQNEEVIVSRGELVEIGGAFRIPEVLETSGATLREVGTTNKTRLSDYERAINENTGALLKVHTSNYRIVGFSESVELKDLVSLGQKHDLPVIYDLGSGAFFDLAPYDIKDEPGVHDGLASGADLICFSGDKLLGGPQAGIIIGKKTYVDRLRRHPLMRALRVDKMTLAALEAMLRIYLDEEQAKKDIPVYAMLGQSLAELKDRATTLATRLKDLGVEIDVVESKAVLGGGSAPDREFPSYALSLKATEALSSAHAAEQLRRLEVPIIGYIEDDALNFDLRTVFAEEEDYLVEALVEIAGPEEDEEDA